MSNVSKQKKKILSDYPLSEKDEVKKAEERTVTSYKRKDENGKTQQYISLQFFCRRLVIIHLG